MIDNLPLLPSYWALWDWNNYNGTATAEQTIAAYEALNNQGLCAEFSRHVWNNIVSLVANSLEEAGIAWDDTYCTADACAINEQYGALTATMFNSVRHNISRLDIFHWSWATIPGKKGYLGREDVRGVTDFGGEADKVYGYYILELTERLNTFLKVLMDVADFGEFAVSVKPMSYEWASLSTAVTVGMEHTRASDIIDRTVLGKAGIRRLLSSEVSVSQGRNKLGKAWVQPLSSTVHSQSAENAYLKLGQPLPLKHAGQICSIPGAVMELINTIPLPGRTSSGSISGSVLTGIPYIGRLQSTKQAMSYGSAAIEMFIPRAMDGMVHSSSHTRTQLTRSGSRFLTGQIPLNSKELAGLSTVVSASLTAMPKTGSYAYSELAWKVSALLAAKEMTASYAWSEMERCSLQSLLSLKEIQSKARVNMSRIRSGIMLGRRHDRTTSRSEAELIPCSSGIARKEVDTYVIAELELMSRYVLESLKKSTGYTATELHRIIAKGIGHNSFVQGNARAVLGRLAVQSVAEVSAVWTGSAAELRGIVTQSIHAMFQSCSRTETSLQVIGTKQLEDRKRLSSYAIAGLSTLGIAPLAIKDALSTASRSDLRRVSCAGKLQSLKQSTTYQYIELDAFIPAMMDSIEQLKSYTLARLDGTGVAGMRQREALKSFLEAEVVRIAVGAASTVLREASREKASLRAIQTAPVQHMEYAESAFTADLRAMIAVPMKTFGIVGSLSAGVLAGVRCINTFQSDGQSLSYHMSVLGISRPRMMDASERSISYSSAKLIKTCSVNPESYYQVNSSSEAVLSEVTAKAFHTKSKSGSIVHAKLWWKASAPLLSKSISVSYGKAELNWKAAAPLFAQNMLKSCVSAELIRQGRKTLGIVGVVQSKGLAELVSIRPDIMHSNTYEWSTGKAWLDGMPGVAGSAKKRYDSHPQAIMLAKVAIGLAASQQSMSFHGAELNSGQSAPAESTGRQNTNVSAELIRVLEKPLNTAVESQSYHSAEAVVLPSEQGKATEEDKTIAIAELVGSKGVPIATRSHAESQEKAELKRTQGKYASYAEKSQSSAKVALSRGIPAYMNAAVMSVSYVSAAMGEEKTWLDPVRTGNNLYIPSAWLSWSDAGVLYIDYAIWLVPIQEGSNLHIRQAYTFWREAENGNIDTDVFLEPIQTGTNLHIRSDIFGGS